MTTKKQTLSDFENQAKQCLTILVSFERDLEEAAGLFNDADSNKLARTEYEKNDFEPNSLTAGFKLAEFRSRDTHQAEFEYYKNLYLEACELAAQAKEALSSKPIDFYRFTDLLYRAMKNSAEAVIRIKTWDIEDEHRSYWNGITNDALYYHEKEVKSVVGTRNVRNRHRLDSDGTQAATEKARQEWLRWQDGFVSYTQTAFIDYVRQNFKKMDGKTMLSDSHLRRKIKEWKAQLTT